MFNEKELRVIKSALNESIASTLKTMNDCDDEWVEDYYSDFLSDNRNVLKKVLIELDNIERKGERKYRLIDVKYVDYNDGFTGNCELRYTITNGIETKTVDKSQYMLYLNNGLIEGN